MIRINNLKFKYDDELVLNNINLEISEGEFVSLIGNNGSGKSTLGRCITGLLEVKEGIITIDDIELNDEMMFEIRKRVGIVFQNPDNQIVSSLIKEDIGFGLQNIGVPDNEADEIIDSVLKMVDLNNIKTEFTNNLSGGEKQRLAIAGILAMNPKYLILDEATSMLDKKSANKVLDIIKKLNKEYKMTILQITHNMDEAVLGDRVIVMDKGRVVLDGKPINVFKKVDFLRKLNLDVPIIMQLMYELQKSGFKVKRQLLNVNECAIYLSKFLSGDSK